MYMQGTIRLLSASRIWVPALIAEWPNALLLTAHRLSPLPGHKRKLSCTVLEVGGHFRHALRFRSVSTAG